MKTSYCLEPYSANFGNLSKVWFLGIYGLAGVGGWWWGPILQYVAGSILAWAILKEQRPRRYSEETCTHSDMCEHLYGRFIPPMISIVPATYVLRESA